MKRTSKYLFRNGHGVYYFRMRVPQPLCQTLGTNEIRFSLKTKARRSALQAREAYHAFFERHFQEYNNPVIPTAPNTQPQSHVDIYYHFEGVAHSLTLDEAAKRLRELHANKSDLDDKASSFYHQQRIEQTTDHELLVNPSRFNRIPCLGEMDQIEADIKYASDHIKAIELGLETEARIVEQIHRLAVITGHAPPTTTQHAGIEHSPAANNPSISRTLTPSRLLSEAIENYGDWQCDTDTWKQSTHKDIMAKLRLLVRLIGDRDITEVDEGAALFALKALKNWPTRLKKNKKLNQCSTEEIIKRTHPAILGARTIDSHIDAYKAFFIWAVKKELTNKDPFADIPRIDKRNPKEKQIPFNNDDLKRIFSADIFTQFGSKSYNSPFHYWGILLCATTGGRVNEIMSLELKDIVTVDNIPCISINDKSSNEQDKKSVKNRHSIRQVPIHPTLIELGLLDYVNTLQKHKTIYLFPEVSKEGTRKGNRLSEYFSERLKPKVGIISEKNQKTMHSFRHTMATKLHRADVNDLQIQQLIGHAIKNPTTAQQIYIKDDEIPTLLQALQKIDLSFCLDQVKPFPVKEWEQGKLKAKSTPRNP
jgi:integrase